MATSSKTTTSTTNTSCSNPIIIGTTTPSSSSSSTVSLSSLVSTSYASLKKNDDLDDIDYYYLTDTIKTATNSNASSAPKDNKYSKLSGTSRYLTQPTDPLRMKSENEGKIEDDNDVVSEASRLPQSMSYTSNLKSMTNIDSGSKFGSAKHFESSNRDVPSYGSTTFNSVTRRSVSKPPPTALESAKNQQSSLLAAARSAPPSELASPVISRVPRKSSAKDHEKDAKQAPLDADVSKTATNVPNVSSGSSAKEDMFSIFSGLKDRLARVSAESREILDRRVFKSGSMDGQKLIASVLVDSASEGEKLNECNECEIGPGVDGQLVVKDADDGCPENVEREDGEGKGKTFKMSKKNSREGENSEGSSRNDDYGDDNDDDVGTDGKSKEATTTSTATTSSSANKSSLSTTTSMKMKQAKETEMKVFKSPAASLGNDDQRLKSHAQKIRESSYNNNSFDINRLMKLVQDSDYPSKKCTFSRKWSGDDCSHNIEDDDDEVGAASSASDLITPEAAVEAFNLTHLHNSTTAPDLKSKRFTSQLFKKSDTQKKNISKSLAESDSGGGISKYDSLVNSDVTFSGQRMMNPFAGDRKESSSSSKPSSSISLTFSSLLSRQKSLPKLTYGGSAGIAVDPAANQQMVDLQDESLKANLNKRSDSKNNLHNLDSDLEYFSLHDNKLDGADEDDPNRPLDVRDANDCNSYLDEDLANTSNNNKTTPADESEHSSPAAKSAKKVRQVTFMSSVLKFQKFRSNLLTKILFYVLLVMTLLIVPLSPYIFGFLVGVLGTIVFGWIFTVLDAVNSLFFYEEDRYREALDICEDREVYYRFGDQWTPDIKLSKNSDDCFKGWLNELPTSASSVASTAASTAASSATLAAAPPPQPIQQQLASSRRNSVISTDDTDVSDLRKETTTATTTTAAAATTTSTKMITFSSSTTPPSPPPPPLATTTTTALPVAYSPETYHISSTVSVFATLEGSNLRLQTPKQGIPKRALWSDDAYANVTFVRQRHFNLLNSKVILLPINIVSKRMWSKKYPIAIELASQQQQQSQGSAAASNVTANSAAAAANSAATSSFVAAGKKTNFTAASQLIRRNRKPDKKSTTAATTLTATTATATAATASIANTNADTEMIVMASSSQKPAIGQSAVLSQSVVLPSNQSKENMKKVIYLFARTSRDKEEWYRRLKAASKGQPWPSRFTDIVSNISNVSGTAASNLLSSSRCKQVSPQTKKNKKLDIITSGLEMDVALLQTTYNAFTSLNAHQQLQQQQQQQQTSTSNNIDYSKLPPELNLFHYALYMSRTIGKPQEAYTNKELTKNIAKSQESDLIKKMNHVKRKIDDEEKVKKGKTKQDKVQSTFTSRPKNPFFKNSTSHISIAPSAITSATPTDADAYEEIITVSDDEMAAAAAAAGLDETRSSKYEKQPQQQQQQQFHFQFHPHRRNSPTRSSRNLQQLQQKQSSSHSLPGTFSTTDMFDGGWMNAGLCDPQLLWLNTLISRLFMDFLRERYWVEKIREKIEKKLSKIHVPHIMDQLTVTGIDLGSNVPVICKSHKPYLDDRGFWVDLQVSYPGGFCITMVSKCNLMKLKHPKQEPAQPQQNIAKDGEVLVSNEEVGANNNTASNATVTNATAASTPGYVGAVNVTKNDAPAKKIAALDSDDEDSAESSTDEEYPLVDEGDEDDVDRAVTSGKQVQPIGKRIMKLVDRISQSKYFQQAVEMKYIKRALEEVSNTKLELNVEVKSLVGSLAINIPPPPTDRLWYGFRGNPIFELAVRPRVGLREVSLKPVTDWIEKKLSLEFQRSFVMPNMDDFRIPLMLDHMTS